MIAIATERTYPTELHPSLVLTIIRTPHEFDALAASWDGLVQRVPCTIFQTFEWQRTWWKVFGELNPQAQLRIITLSENGVLKAVAPFFLETLDIFAGLSVRRLAFIGHGISDYLDVIAEPGFAVPLAQAIVRHVLSVADAPDALSVAELPSGSMFLPAFEHELKTTPYRWETFVSAHCPKTALKQTWDATLAAFSRKHRKDILYERRHIERNFTVAFTETTDPNQLPDDMDEFIALHQERWHMAGHPGVFADSAQARFHRAVAPALFARGWLFLAFLSLDGERIAVNYGFRFKEALSTYLNGMADRDRVAKFSPGKVLHSYSMQRACELHCTEYDFMRGREPYKYAFDAVDHENKSIVAYRSRRARAIAGALLLKESFTRRATQESTMVKHIAARNGWVSRELAHYLWSRLTQNAADGVKKMRSPEKPVTDLR